MSTTRLVLPSILAAFLLFSTSAQAQRLITPQNIAPPGAPSASFTVEQGSTDLQPTPEPFYAIFGIGTSPAPAQVLECSGSVTFSGDTSWLDIQQTFACAPVPDARYGADFEAIAYEVRINPGVVATLPPGEYTASYTAVSSLRYISGLDEQERADSSNETGTFTLTVTGPAPEEPPPEEPAPEEPAPEEPAPGEPSPEPDANALKPLTAPGTPQFEIANVIDRICPDPDRTLSTSLQDACNAMIGSALSDNPEDQEKARQAISAATPDGVSAARSDALASINVQSLNIAGRLAALRTGVGGFSAAGLQFDIDGNRISGQQVHGLAEALASGGAASADDSGFSRLGVFVSGSITSGDRSRTTNVDGFDYDVLGLTLGVDYRLSDNLIVGAAVGYSSTEAETFAQISPIDGSSFRRGKLDADSYSFTLYGSHYQTDEFFIDGSLSYGRSDYDQRRRVQYTLPGAIAGPEQAVVDQTFEASFKGNQLGLSLLTGYDFRRDALTFTPTARLQYIRARVNGYSERQGSNPDAAGADLNFEIDSQRYRSFALGLGGQVSYAVSQSWGILQPFASLEYVHDFEKNDQAVTGRFVNDDITGTQGKVDFNLPVDSRDQNYFNLGLGVSAQFANGAAGFISYDRILGYDDLKQHRINAGVRFEF